MYLLFNNSHSALRYSRNTVQNGKIFSWILMDRSLSNKMASTGFALTRFARSDLATPSRPDESVVYFACSSDPYVKQGSNINE